jgi:hypothetical protein
MQYELAKKGQAPRPLDKVTEHFKNIVTQFNPIMMPKVMQDVGTIGTNIASTIVSPYADILSNAQASGAAGLHRLAGNEQAALEAEARQRPVTPSSLMREPTLPVTREFEQGLGKAFVASKLPPIGPGSGMPGSAPVSPRPMFTPNDLRVVGAEATRVGRQIGDIPTDFANAQSGFQRIDPVTNQPVMGARIQSGVDRLGDIMEQRKMQGLTPIPGLPAALQPETAMYAVRPQGSRLTTPVVPATARGFSPPIDPVNDMFKEVVGLDPERAEVTPTLLHSLNNRVQFNNLPNDRDAINGFRSFMQNKAQEMYPEAETPRQALEIFNAMHYDTPSRHAVENKMFDEFIQTPEGQQLVPNAVSTDEMAKRHDAATEGLKNMWGKYLVKNLGTEGNPLVKMAAEKGLTYLPAEDVLRIASEEAYTASANRQKAGMPVQGSFAQSIANLKQEIEAISLPLQNAANAEQSLGQAAHIAGIDPASVPEYLEARKNAAKLNKQKNELQKKLDNLTLASAYEVFEDASVKPAPAETLLKEMQPSERGFYPGLKEAAIRGEKGYKTSIGSLEYMGFVKAADNFYNDVLQGKIPADRAATYPVDKYIRENAEARIKVEQAAKANFETYKNDVLASLKQTADALPADKKFGNVGVVELTKDTPINDANKEVAASTEALDICIGEGGGGKGTRNLFTGKKDPNRTAIVNLLTGEPNPDASRHTSTYVDGLQRGEQLPMFRDMETGMPIAALQFNVASSMQSNGQPMFNIGYASGARNGRIEAKYADGIRDYLNTRANDIAGIGSNLEDNTGIYDTTNRSSLSKARKSAQVSENEMKAVDWNSMPRFMTAKDVKQAVKGNVPAVVPQQTPALQEDIGQLQVALGDNVDFVINEAVQNSNLDAPEELERRLNAVFYAMQSQYFPTLLADPISSLNRALEYLEYEIDRRSNNASEISQEMVTALERYSAELESARDDLVSQQQRAVQPVLQAPQTPQLTEENVRDALLLNMPVEQVPGYQLLEQSFNDVFDVEVFRTDPRQTVHDIREQILGHIQYVEEMTDEELRDYGIDSRDDANIIVNDLLGSVDRLNNLEETLQTAPAPQAPAPQAPATQVAPMQQAEQLLQQIERPLRSTNDGIVNDALQEYARSLQRYASNQLQNGMDPITVANGMRDTINTLRNIVLTQPTDPTRNFMTDQLGEYVSALRLAIDGIGQWIETQNQQAAAPQRANLPAEVQQNIDQRNQDISNAYLNALIPNTNIAIIDQSLSEFADLLHSMSTNLYGAGFNTAEIVERLQDRIRTEITELSNTDRVMNRGLNVAEADTIRSRLNTAYGDLTEVREAYQVPNRQGPATTESITTAIQTAFTPNTGSPTADAWLSQYGDVLANQIVEFENAGNNPAEVASLVDNEIRGQLHNLLRLNEQQTGLTSAENLMARTRLETAIGNIRFNATPPEPMVELNFEPDTMHGANEPYTVQSAIDMARDVFEQERIDANNFDIPSIEQSIYALREGLFDDARIRRLSENQRQSFSEDVAFRLQNMLDDINARNRRPNQVLVAEPGRAREAIDNALQNISNDYDTTVADAVRVVTNAISEHVNPGDELSEYVYQLRRHRPRISQDIRDGLDHVADELESISQEIPRQRQVQPVLPAPATAPYAPIPTILSGESVTSLVRDMHGLAVEQVDRAFDEITNVNSPEEIQNIIGVTRAYRMGPWENFSEAQRELLARNLESYVQDNTPPNTPPPEEPPQRRGPFRPGGASAVRGVPLGNLNIQPSITAEAFRGPDRQPVSNFLQQVKSMPGVTQEGLKTGLMAFENMDPSRQMTKAEFARELLPSSYDIVNLAGTATVDRHTMDMIESMIQDDPDASRDVFESMEGLTDIARKEIVDYLNDNPGGHFEWHMFSDKAKKSFAKTNGLIKDAASFLDQWANSQEHLKEQIYTEQYGQDINEDGYKYEDVQRLTIPSMGDEYGEFGVTHPDQSGMYHHYDNAPEGTIGHFRGTYNPADPLELKTVTNETLTTKPGSYVIEEIQSDAQKGSAQKAHLHQVHGVLFKAAIQKALELGADTVYLPTAKVIASERPSVTGWEARPDDRGLIMQVPIRKDTTSKFAPIYDQAIVKEGLKPLLKIPGVTSKMVNGYHEISFTPEAKEHILNGPGQTIPGYKKGGRVHQFPSVEQMKNELMMRRA